jgi:hypothetical protein
LRRIAVSFQRDRKSSSPSRRCSVTSVPRFARSIVSTVYWPSSFVMSHSQRHAFAPQAGPARRVTSVTLSATMNDE